LKQSGRKYNRIVVKIGSSILCSEGERIDDAVFKGIAAQISNLVKNGTEVVIVSSGAIALGMHHLGLTDRPKELFYLQAAAAVGQTDLMNSYSRFFKDSFKTAQLLLTWEDFSNHTRYLNAKNTVNTLLRLKTVPIINENDTVSTDEIKFGDNDKLSALVASLISADLLIILSDIDGLWDAEKKVIRVVDKIDHAIKQLACPTDKKRCVGGMITKIEAAKIAVNSGIPCLIVNGKKTAVIEDSVREPGTHGTLFVSKEGYLNEKDRWIAYGTKPKGYIFVDDGARKAILAKKSLLSVGVRCCKGTFENGDIVSLCDSFKNEFARGKAGISSKQLEKVCGQHSDKEVVHCDNIVFTE